MRTLQKNTESKSNRHSPFFRGNKSSGFISGQAKLNVGKPNDKYETEADKVADKVVSLPQNENQSFFADNQSNTVQRKGPGLIQEKPLAATITSFVQRQEEEEEAIQPKLDNSKSIQMEEEEEAAQPKLETGYSIQKQEEEEEELQTKLERNPSVQKQEEEEENSSIAQNSTEQTVQQQLNNSNGGGEALPHDTKSEMEGNFGADFSQVRTHKDSNAVKMNKELGAQAFTHGNNIYFNEGKFSPGTKPGKQLLAHELTHTIQQGASNVEQSSESSNVANNGGSESQTAERDVAISNERTESSESETGNTQGQVSNEANNGGVESQIEEREAISPAESPAASASRAGDTQEQIPNLLDSGGSESQAAERDATISIERTESSELNSGNQQERVSTGSNPESTTQQDQNSTSQAQEENGASQTESEIQNRVVSTQQSQTGSEVQEGIEQQAETQGAAQQAQASEQTGVSGELIGSGSGRENTQQEQVVTGTSETQNVETESPLNNSVETGSSSSNSDAMIQIMSSPDSPVKTQGINLSMLIMAGRMFSQEQIIQQGALRRQKVNQQFHGVRSGLISFFNDNVALVRSFVKANTALVGNVSTQTISKVVGAAMNAIGKGETLSGTIAGTIVGQFSRTSGFVTTRVATIISRIMNLVNSVPLPNIPGIQTIRNTALNLGSRIAGVIQKFLGAALGGIGRAFSTGITMLSTILNKLKAKVLQIMMKIITVITRAIVKIIKALNNILKKVISILRRILFGTVLPKLRALRARMLQTINQLELAALQQIRDTEEENIETIASYVVAESGDGDGSTESIPGERRSRQETINTMKLIVARAMARFLITVQLFKIQTTSIVSLFVSNLISLARSIKSRIKALAGRTLSAIMSFSMFVVSVIQQIFNPIKASIQNILHRTYTIVFRLVRNVSDLIRRPVSKVVAMAEKSLTRLRNTVRRLFLRI